LIGERLCKQLRVRLGEAVALQLVPRHPLQGIRGERAGLAREGRAEEGVDLDGEIGVGVPDDGGRGVHSDAETGLFSNFALGGGGELFAGKAAAPRELPQTPECGALGAPRDQDAAVLLDDRDGDANCHRRISECSS